jgi:cell division protein FtsI/penicillin-binding protein 2
MADLRGSYRRGPAPRRRHRHRRRRLGAAALVLLAAAVALVAVAAALAAALTGGRFADVALAGATRGQAAARWRRLREGMGGSRPAVALVGVHDSGGRTSARLRWRWRLPAGRTWSYTTSAALVLRSGRWVAMWAPTLLQPALREGRSLHLAVTQARRASILDAAGHRLVVPRPVVYVGVEPRRVKKLGRLARTLHRVLGIDATELVRAVRAAAPTAFVPVITLRRGDYERLRSILHPLPGTVFATGSLPLAPTRSFARALLGTIGHPTAEMLQRSGSRYSAGEMVGLSGLEQAFDGTLGGTPGVAVQVVGAHGSVLRTLYRVPPTPGRPLRTTLDVAAQEAADAAIAKARLPTALVAIRISTGAVIASAIGPDPGGYDIALQGEYPPGSTFKVVTALALLEGGEQPTDTIACPARITVDGRQFHNAEHEVLGTITFAQAFAASCNTAFVGLSAKVPGASLPRTARSLGLGRPLALGLPAFGGVVPEPGDGVDLAAEAFGQGRILVSPIAMAGVAAAVARGRYVPPHLIEGAAAPAQPPADAPLPAAAVATLRTLMREVVTGGTATALASQPGLPVYGKTGTAEYGSASPPRTDAWFVGFQGDVAFGCLVAGTKNGFGGSVAAPIVGRFLAALQP